MQTSKGSRSLAFLGWSCWFQHFRYSVHIPDLNIKAVVCKSMIIDTYIQSFMIYTSTRLELALGSSNLQQATAIAQDSLSILVLGDEANLLKAIHNVSHAPDLSGELVTRDNRGGEAGLELLEVLGVAASKLSENTVSGGVPAEKTVDDDTAEAHLHTGLGGGVERVIVTVETVGDGNQPWSTFPYV